MPFKWLKRRRSLAPTDSRPHPSPISAASVAPTTSSSSSSQTEPRIRRRKSFFQTLRGVRDHSEKQRKRASSFGGDAPIPKSLESAPPVPPLPKGKVPIAGKFARAPPSAFPGTQQDEDAHPRSLDPRLANTAPPRVSGPVKAVQLDDFDAQLTEFGVMNPLDALDRLDASDAASAAAASTPSRTRPASTLPMPRSTLPAQTSVAKKRTSMLDGPLPPPPPGATVTPTKRTSTPKRFSMQNAPPLPPAFKPAANPPPSFNPSWTATAPMTLPSPVPSSKMTPSPAPPSPSPSLTPAEETTPVSSMRRSVAQRTLIPLDMKEAAMKDSPPPLSTKDSPSLVSTPQDSPSSVSKSISPSAFDRDRPRRTSMTTRKPVPKLSLAELGIDNDAAPSPSPSPSARVTGPVVPRSPRSARTPMLPEPQPAESTLAPKVLAPSISAVGLNMMADGKEPEDGMTGRARDASFTLPIGESVLDSFGADDGSAPAVLAVDDAAAKDAKEDAFTDADEGGSPETTATSTAETVRPSTELDSSNTGTSLVTAVKNLTLDESKTPTPQVAPSPAVDLLEQSESSPEPSTPAAAVAAVSEPPEESMAPAVPSTVSVLKLATTSSAALPAEGQSPSVPSPSPLSPGSSVLSPTGTPELNYASDEATIASRSTASMAPPVESSSASTTPQPVPATEPEPPAAPIDFSQPASPVDSSQPISPVDFSQPVEDVEPPKQPDSPCSAPHAETTNPLPTDETTPLASTVDFSTPTVSKSTSANTTMSQSPSNSTDDWASSNTHSSAAFPVTPPNGLGSELSMTSVEADKVSISHSQTFGQLGARPKEPSSPTSYRPISPMPSYPTSPSTPNRSTSPLNIRTSSPSSPQSLTRASSTSPTRNIPRVRTTSRTPSVANLRPVNRCAVTPPVPSSGEPTLDEFMSIFRQVSQRPKDVSIKAAAAQAERKKVR